MVDPHFTRHTSDVDQAIKKSVNVEIQFTQPRRQHFTFDERHKTSSVNDDDVRDGRFSQLGQKFLGCSLSAANQL